MSMFTPNIIQQISQKKTHIRTMSEHSSIHCSLKKKKETQLSTQKVKKNMDLSSATQNYEYERKKNRDITVKYIQFFKQNNE
jgi:hypothetical protein